MGNTVNKYKILVGKPLENAHLEDQGRLGKVLLRWVRKLGTSGDWRQIRLQVTRPMDGLINTGKRPSCPMVNLTFGLC
jgi:hypothetical protein